MNKETVLLVTAMLTVTCIVCFARDKILESKNQPAASSVSESAESEDSMTSVSPDIDINFNSGNDVESISDEKLRSIANHDFKTADFVHDLACQPDLFQTEWYGAGTDTEEKLLYAPVWSNEETNVKKTISAEELKDFAKQRNEEIAVSSADAEYIFCGETDDYLEYSVRFTSHNEYYDNDSLVGNDTYRAYRVIYPKHTVMLESDCSLTQYFAGTPTLESVQSCFDLEFSLDDEPVLYREYTETDNAFQCTYYNLTWETLQTFDVADDAAPILQLNKNTILLDKKTNQITKHSEPVKSTTAE